MRSYIDKYGRRKGTPPPGRFDSMFNALKNVDISTLQESLGRLSDAVRNLKVPEIRGPWNGDSKENDSL